MSGAGRWPSSRTRMRRSGETWMMVLWMSLPGRCLGGVISSERSTSGEFNILLEGLECEAKCCRGAGDSEGRTSWTGKGEKDDYVSVVGFMLYYAHHLRDPTTLHVNAPAFLMGGYSYGSLITTLIPPLSNILPYFESPEIGSAAAEIRLRAENLAEHERDILARARDARRSRVGGSPGRSPGIRVGGTESGEVRRSADGRRGFRDGGIRRSIGDVMARKKKARGSEDKGEQREGPVRLERVELVVPGVAYLLISPLQGAIAHLATVSLPSWFPTPRLPFRHRRGASQDAEQPQHDQVGRETPPEDLKLTQNPTLAIFGDTDVFVSVAKLRGWAGRMQGRHESRFHAVEVSTAGHFWVEEGVLDKMLGAVSGFSRGVFEGDGRF